MILTTKYNLPQRAHCCILAGPLKTIHWLPATQTNYLTLGIHQSLADTNTDAVTEVRSSEYNHKIMDLRPLSDYFDLPSNSQYYYKATIKTMKRRDVENACRRA